MNETHPYTGDQPDRPKSSASDSPNGDAARIIINQQQGLEIQPGSRHRILNEGGGDLEFLLCSQPSTAGDRTNV